MKWLDHAARRAALLMLCVLALPVHASDWIAPDRDLQRKLQSRIDASPAWRQLVRQQRMAVCAVDLQSSPPRYAAINGEHMMYAASLPKIAVLLAVYTAFEDGRLQESPAIRRDLAAMIRYSDNPAATRLIDLVGMRQIQHTLRDARFDFYDESRGGGLWVGKRYAPTGPRIGDPLHDISHGATADQVCRFYTQLANGELISPRRSRQMLEDLGNPGLHHKFVAALDHAAPDAEVYRKSGSWRQWHADSALVRDDGWRNYVLVGLVESTAGENVLRDLVPAVESVLRPRNGATIARARPDAEPRRTR